jgi:KDO2-lipid IV(A) lauroyltransferase
MDLQSLLQSRRAGGIALRISRLLPPWTGYRLADFIAGRIAASTDTPMVRSIRVNQWIASGKELEGDALDLAVRSTIGYVARSFYTLFHYLDNLESFQDLIDYDERVQAVIDHPQKGERGLIVVGVHMSNFDLVAQAAARSGLRAIALSVPDPDEAIEWQHEFRRQSGLEILPATIRNIRETIERLKAGEMVITGLDRPVQDPNYRPHFFGHPAFVPVHYIQLAMRAQVPLVVMGAVEGPDRRIKVMASDMIELDEYPDRKMSIIHNAEKVLGVAEGFIRQAPQQWVILQTVWPDLGSQVP